MKLYKDPVIANAGTYVGNDTENRAIPHGLGRTPKWVNIVGASGGFGYVASICQSGKLYNHAANLDFDVTAWDGTYFYVGDAANYHQSMNANGVTHRWSAS